MNEEEKQRQMWEQMMREQRFSYLQEQGGGSPYQTQISQMPQRPPDTISNYEPSLAERMGNGLGGFLSDSGIISNPYGAQQIGDNLSSLGRFLPVIGDMTSGDEFGTAAAQGDGYGMASSAVGAIPIVGDAINKGGKFFKGAPLPNFSSFNLNSAKNVGNGGLYSADQYDYGNK